MTSPTMTGAEVRRVAKLANLALSEGEVTRMCGELSAILTYMRSLQAVPVEGVEPTFHPVPLTCPLRDDVQLPGLSQAEVLASAPSAEAGAFAVPKVLDGEGS